jgi:hypothetical protein
MIKPEKNLFILGAGASSHFGYPLGAELIPSMERFLERIDAGKRTDEVNQVTRDDLAKAREFITKIQQFNPLNIDYYLHNNNAEKEIAQKLIESTLTWIQDDNRFSDNGNKIKPWSPEAANTIVTETMKQRSPNLLDYIYEAKNWIKFIHHALVSNVRFENRIEDIKSNLENVSFITFNYDVSLEQGLYRYFSKSELFKDVCAYLADSWYQSNIYHVYGKISHKDYEPVYTTGDKFGIFEKSKGSGLDVISPEKANIIDNKAVEIIRNANNIYFLGYGFDSFNNKRIGLSTELKQSKNLKRLFYTNFSNSLIVDSMVRSFLDGEFSTLRADNRITQCFRKSSAYPVNRRWVVDIVKSVNSVYKALELDLNIPI